MSTVIGIMDAYLGGLEKCDQLLVQHAFAPFRFTPVTLELDRVEESRLLTREVVLDTVKLVVFGKNEEDLNERAAVIAERGESIITGIANQQFEESFLPKEEVCILPTILELRDLHEKYPVFGILIGVHDMQCDDCETCYGEGEEEVDELLEDDRTPEQMIASLPDYDQRLLVTLAQRFLENIKRRFLASQRLSLRTSDGAQLAEILDEMDWLPALAQAFSKESFLWMAMNPYFFRETFQYTDASEELLNIFWEFEADLVLQLPFDLQQAYEESASMLSGASTTEFFARV